MSAKFLAENLFLHGTSGLCTGARESPSSSGNTNDVKHRLRLCHVVERPDFDGFGFTVYTLVDKPGQYIGKVECGSPAAATGIGLYRRHRRPDFYFVTLY